MKKLLIILITGFAQQTTAQEKPHYLNVLAANGLNMRSRPDATARVITKIAYGKRAEVLEKTDVVLQLGWISDCWYRVRFRGREGYIFGGYLSRLPAPQETAGNVSLPNLLLLYAEDVFNPDGKAVISTEPSRNGDTLHHMLQRFVGGIELEMEQQGYRTSVLLLLPSDVEKGYVLLEALLKKGNRKELLEQLRFVKGKDGRLERINNAGGTVRIRKLSDESVGMRLTAYAEQVYK